MLLSYIDYLIENDTELLQTLRDVTFRHSPKSNFWSGVAKGMNPLSWGNYVTNKHFNAVHNVASSDRYGPDMRFLAKAFKQGLSSKGAEQAIKNVSSHNLGVTVGGTGLGLLSANTAANIGKVNETGLTPAGADLANKALIGAGIGTAGLGAYGAYKLLKKKRKDSK